MLAIFESLGGWELVIVLVGALLLFGKDLPKVAADAGAQFTKLRRNLDSAWRDTGLEREVRQIRDAIPRDLSLTDVARAASEKLAVRLEDSSGQELDLQRPVPPPLAETVARGTPEAAPPAEVAGAPAGPGPDAPAGGAERPQDPPAAA